MKKFFSKFINIAWSFVVVVSVLFGFYSYFHEKKPDIQFTILNDPNVFDVYRSVNDLEVFFQGKNVEKENLNLRLYTVRIENDGESDVLKNFYDDNLPWGFSVDAGEIVSDPRIIRSNSQYLDDNLKPLVKEGRVNFEKVIFEHGKYLVLEFLVLHKKTGDPAINPFGKIAGIDKFAVIKDLEQENRSMWSELLDGGPMLHMIRLIAYTAISILLLILFAYLIELFGKLKKVFVQKKRHRFFQRYIDQDRMLNNIDPINPDIETFLKGVYVQDGLHGLKELRKRLKHEKQFIVDIEKDNFSERVYKILDHKGTDYPVVTDNIEWFDSVRFDSDQLKKLIVTSNNSKTLDPKLRFELNRVIPFLNKLDK